MNNKPQDKILSSGVLIACALSIEAEPVIKYYKLQHLFSEYGFKLYGLRLKKKPKPTQENVVVNVLVTGVGKINMAAALMWAQQLCAPEAFVNYGIAGHGSADIGDFFLINKVIDEVGAKSYFPSIFFSWREKTTQLKTVDKPSDEYLVDCAYDMEASAFCDMANRFVGTESAHILKVISDNAEQNYEHVSRQGCQKYIEGSMFALNKLVEVLHINFVTQENDLPEIIHKMRERWHITTAQEQQLHEALLSALVVEKNTGLTSPDWQSFEHLKDFLQVSKNWVMNIKPKLSL